MKIEKRTRAETPALPRKTQEICCRATEGLRNTSNPEAQPQQSRPTESDDVAGNQQEAASHASNSRLPSKRKNRTEGPATSAEEEKQCPPQPRQGGEKRDYLAGYLTRKSLVEKRSLSRLRSMVDRWVEGGYLQPGSRLSPGGCQECDPEAEEPGWLLGPPGREEEQQDEPRRPGRSASVIPSWAGPELRSVSSVGQRRGEPDPGG
ncbi:hypothetical protein NDU88_006598 [Pleurodeles waltl]|uniref:Uncharacterized protein n=1 Tax=Pleurodeles waltl TaxID=8319 RepID=A0AAV7UMD2_PLEWA|nr:hypothetical protein NDU88_006598 [Pleurodeles waltl]